MTSAPQTSTAARQVNPTEVGWQFVPQYYTFVNKQPNRLHCFYTKNSTFSHGTEGEDTKACFGQQVRASFHLLGLVHRGSSRAGSLTTSALTIGNPQQDHGAEL